MSYRGEDVNKTATRLIAIHSLEKATWLKYDLIVPIDWENDNAIPATAEVQIGKMHNKQINGVSVKTVLSQEITFNYVSGIKCKPCVRYTPL